MSIRTIAVELLLAGGTGVVEIPSPCIYQSCIPDSGVHISTALGKVETNLSFELFRNGPSGYPSPELSRARLPFAKNGNEDESNRANRGEAARRIEAVDLSAQRFEYRAKHGEANTARCQKWYELLSLSAALDHLR